MTIPAKHLKSLFWTACWAGHDRRQQSLDQYRTRLRPSFMHLPLYPGLYPARQKRSPNESKTVHLVKNFRKQNPLNSNQFQNSPR